MRKKYALLLAALMAASMLTACGTKAKIAEPQVMMNMAYDEGYYAPDVHEFSEEAAYASGAVANRASKTAATVELPQNHKWIITMSLNAETNDLDAALAALSSRINGMGGYVESQQINNSSSYRRTRSASMTIRVPAETVDDFVNEVSGITNITSNSRYVRDVTLAYTDTEGRVTALKTEEQRLLELMEQAEKMSDLLEVESRLTEVRYQLESHASQLRLYDNQIDYATVDIYISEVETYTPAEDPGFLQRIRDGLSDSIVDLGETIVDTIVWVIVDLPYLIVLALLVWGATVLVKRRIRKSKAKKAAQKAGE